MWGNKKKQVQVSEFFKGTNIFNKLADSVFGKIKQTFNEIFTKQDIDQYTLPKVIVIGNESSGKSSLLENITKCQLFPRDSKLCTKCPVHVKLTNGACKYIVHCPTENNDEFKTIEVKNKNEIYGVINEYMKRLPPDHISESEILIDITDQDVPTFEFYDLPGIRTYPQDSAEMTTKLCKKYLSDKNSIVLCVVPATTPRLTSCQGIALISEMGMEHNCILALTMADKLQQDDIEELLIKRIIKTSDELNGLNFAGYIAVVNRIHSDSHSLEENDTNEIKWFNENILQCVPDEYKKYEQCIQNNITITNLVSRMDELYNEFIHRDWKPRILQTITTKIDDLQFKYDNMGDENIDPDELNLMIGDFIHSIYDNIWDFCRVPIISLNELFADDMDRVDEVADGDEDNKSEKYHESKKLIDDNITNYSNFEISFIENIIDKYFEDEKNHKIVRFLKVKNDIIFKLNESFVLLTQGNIRKIHKNIERHMLSYFLTHDSLRPTYTYYNDTFRLYKLLVLYPLLNLKLDYGTEDYIESVEYQQKRTLLLETIDKTRNHYDFINKLKNAKQ